MAAIVGAQVEMEDTYLLYLPAAHSEHEAVDVAPVALFIVIHIESRYTHTYIRVSSTKVIMKDSVICIHQA